MTDRVILAEASEYDAFIGALVARKNALGLTNAMIDEMTGLPVGYTGKTFGAAHLKVPGPVSFGLFCAALGVRVLVVEDPEAMARFASMREKRARPMADAVRTASLGKVQTKRFLPTISREMQKRSRDTYREVTKASTRRRVARTAAKARWARPRPRRNQDRARPP